MTTLIVHCDRCGERIDAARTLATIESGPLRALWPTLDLCPSRAKALGKWIGKGSGRVVAATGAPQGA